MKWIFNISPDDKSFTSTIKMPFVQLIGFVSSRKTNEKLQKLRTQKYCDNCEEKLSGEEAFAPTDETVVCAECWENIQTGRKLNYEWFGKVD